MKGNFYRLRYNRLSQIILLVFLIIPNIETIQLLVEKLNYGTNYHPAIAFFLSGTSRGHATQILLLWFLPLYFLLLGADTPIQDSETGYKNILITKMGKHKHIISKYYTSFMISSGAMAVALLINFLLVSIFFLNGNFMKGLDDMQFKDNLLFNSSIHHPYMAIAGFSMVAIIISGFIGVMATSLSMFFPQRKYAYAAAFFIWFMFIFKENSVMFLLQPFAEYGFDVLIPILIQTLAVLLIIPILVYFYEVRFNEN